MTDTQPNLLFIIPGFLHIEPYQKLLYHQDFPLGTLQLMSYLRKNANVRTDIIDLRLEEENFSDLSTGKFNEQLFKEVFISLLERNNIQNYNNIGISCYTSFQFVQTEIISKLLKERFPNINIIIGGYHPTAVAEDFLYEGAPYDYIIHGEAELLLFDLLGSLLSNQKKENSLPKTLINHNPLDINSLPFPDYEYFIEKYPTSKSFRLDLYFSRGCPYQCAFCADNYKFRTFTKSKFVDYLNKLDSFVDKHNIENPKIGFADQSFNRIPISNKIMDFLIQNHYKERYNLSCQSRIETINEGSAIIKRMIKCGLIVGYGLESTHKELLVEMHKTEDPTSYLKNAEKIIEIYKDKSDTYCRLNILCGFPGETQESFDETVRFINFTAIDENIQVSPSLFSNYPNVYVYRNMNYYEEKFGTVFIKEWWKLGKNLFKNSVPAMPSQHYSLRELIGDYKDKYISILKHFKHDTFANLVVWKRFYNNWYKELE